MDTVGGHSGCNEYSGYSGHRNAVDNVDTGDAVDTVGGHSACRCSGGTQWLQWMQWML